MDDLLGGSGSWRNIQDVVREAFKALHDVVRVQGERIVELEAQLVNKADASQVHSLEVSLSNKPTFAEMGRATEELRRQLAVKEDIEGFRAQLHQKADKSELRDLYTGVTLATSRTSSAAELETIVRQQQREIGRLRTELENRPTDEALSKRFATVDDVRGALQMKADREQLSEALARGVTHEQMETSLKELPTVAKLDKVLSRKVDMDTMVEALQDRPQRAEVAELVALEVGKQQLDDARARREQTEPLQEVVRIAELKANKADVQEALAAKVTRSELLEVLQTKVGVAELESRLKATTDVLASEVKQAIVTTQQQLVAVLNKKAFKADVHRSLQLKANADDVQGWLARKAEVADVRDALSHKADSDDTKRALELRACLDDVVALRKQLESSKSAWREPLDALAKGIDSKAEVADVCALLDQKANIVDINGALTQVNTEIERLCGVTTDGNAQGGAAAEDITRLELDIKALRQVVHKELNIGRWIWKAGRVGEDRAVPWNVQTTNTTPDNFVWVRDTTEITCVAPGLYEITLGFFTERDPAVQPVDSLRRWSMIPLSIPNQLHPCVTLFGRGFASNLSPSQQPAR